MSFSSDCRIQHFCRFCGVANNWDGLWRASIFLLFWITPNLFACVQMKPECLSFVLKFYQKPLAGLVQECLNRSSAECGFIAVTALGKPSSTDESPKSFRAVAEVHRPRPNTSHQEAVGCGVNEEQTRECASQVKTC